MSRYLTPVYGFGYLLALYISVLLNSCGSQPEIKSYSQESIAAKEAASNDVPASEPPAPSAPESSDAKPINSETQTPNVCTPEETRLVKEITFSSAVETNDLKPPLSTNFGITTHNSFGVYNQLFHRNDSEGRELLNLAEKYDISIKWATPKPGEYYWKLIGLHHLFPLENTGRHNIYIEMLDENGNPVRDRNYFLEKNITQFPKETIMMDKPANEPFTNIPMFKGNTLSVKILGESSNSNDLSDEVVNLHSAHPDEALPNGELHNTLYHHSFYLVYRKTLQEVKPEVKGKLTISIEEPKGEILTLRSDRGEQTYQLSSEALTSLVISNLELSKFQVLIGNKEINYPKELTLTPETPFAEIEIVKDTLGASDCP